MLSDADYTMIFNDIRGKYGEDLAQEAAIRILRLLQRRAAQGVTHQDDLLGLARTIAKRLSMNNQRYLKHQKAIPFSALGDGSVHAIEALEALLDERDPAQIVAAREVLNTLPDVLIEQELRVETTLEAFATNADRVRYQHMKAKIKTQIV